MDKQEKLRLAAEANLRDNALLVKLYSAIRAPSFPRQREETKRKYLDEVAYLEQKLAPTPTPYRNIVQLDEGIWGWVKRLFKKEKR